MEKVQQMAEKVYYLYMKLPKIIQFMIKLVYYVLRTIYRLLRKVYRFFKKTFTKNVAVPVISANTNNNVETVMNETNKNNIYEIEEKDYILPKKKLKPGKLRISWIIPRPIKGSGGHRNFYRIISYLGAQGHEVRVYIDYKKSFSPDPCTSGNQAYNFIKDNFIDLHASVIYGTDNIKKCDVLFATHYESAYIVKQNEKKAKEIMYFIQDYESYFTAMGDEFIRAYQSYKLGLYPITSGPWPLCFLRKDFGVNYGYSFYFPLDTSIYNISKGQKKDKNSIVFFAKPHMPRRCYKLGLDALKIVKEKMPDVTIHFFGENASSYDDVPFEFVNHGLVPTITELGDLYRKCEVGIAFSTTNPSLVPYEMISCGVAVVDLDFNDNEVNYGGRENITLAEPFAEKVAEKIIFLLNNKKDRERVVKRGLKYCKIFPSEKKMCEGIEREIIKVYEKGR